MLILHTFYLERLIILQDVTIRYTESVIQCRLMVVPGVTTKFVSYCLQIVAYILIGMLTAISVTV